MEPSIALPGGSVSCRYISPHAPQVQLRSSEVIAYGLGSFAGTMPYQFRSSSE